MLDPKIIRQDVEAVATQLKTRGVVFETARFLALEEKRKHWQVIVQDLQNERNVLSKEVGFIKSKGGNPHLQMEKVKHIGESLNAADVQLEQTQSELHDLLSMVPNLPHSSVPLGMSEEDNQVVRHWGEPRSFDFTPKDHVDLGVKWGMDFAAASKISGARFVVLHGVVAKLQRALAQWMLDFHIEKHQYQEIYVPYLVKPETLYGTGQLPKLKADLFVFQGVHDLYLIPTSESPVTNTVRDTILEANQLPLKYVCLSPCFRSEAGSYGKDTRGMLRQHQFEKVELVQMVHPETSYQALEELTNHAEKILQALKLPYRVTALCTADLGFYAAKTYDLEVWLPGQNTYREISSCSNTESFQARRMKARFRDVTGKTEWLHTLNGSGLAVGRTLVAVLENYQDEQGNVHIPDVLQPYMNGLAVIQ